MCKILLIAFILLNLTSCEETKTAAKEVSFIDTIDLTNATKDGIYMNGYVVEIEYGQLKSLNGKKVKITGKPTMVKGLENDSKEDVKVIKQGRSKDVIHIKSPKIEIITD